MPTYYVGPGGNDGNSGLTWALRKLTLNGAEDVPVIAGDIVYVGPSVYREVLVIDVSGAGGSPITYIGDVTGEHTDGVGGIVRITGSNNDITAVRADCIQSNNRDYRTFRGLTFDLGINYSINAFGGESDWIIEDCNFIHSINGTFIFIGTINQSNWIIRRCYFSSSFRGILFTNGGGPAIGNTGHLIENCIFAGMDGSNVVVFRVGGITIRNGLHFGGAGVAVECIGTAGTGAGQFTSVNDCIVAGMRFGFVGTVVGDIVENYNTLTNLNVARVNTAVGANSNIHPPLFQPPVLLDGFQFPWWFTELSEWSQIRAITGVATAADDLLGLPRPATAAKLSWGPIQFDDMERETGTVRTGLVSLALHDAGRHQIWVPIDDTETTIEIYVQREANYAGLLPQMIIKQPGQVDRVTTDVGAAGAWNLLTDTFVPAALPPYVVVELVSRNTAAAGAFETFFDDLAVT